MGQVSRTDEKCQQCVLLCLITTAWLRGCDRCPLLLALDRSQC